MTSTVHRWFVELARADGSAAGRAPIEPDWGAAYEAARFAGIRQGRLPARRGSTPGAIEPIWHAELGAPYVGAIRARVPAEAGAFGESDISIDYLRRSAKEGLARLVETSGVTVGEDWRYRIVASPDDVPRLDPSSAVDPEEITFAVEDVTPPLELSVRALGPLLVEAGAYGPDVADDVRVLISRDVLDETIVIAHRAGDLETGGFLLGRMHRDGAGGEIFVHVTGQIRAEHTECERTRMVFTPATWVAALDAVARRGAGEEICGWYHHHPNFCTDCPIERRAQCPLSSNFFSTEDVDVHRVCFPRGHQTGLLLSTDDDGGMRIALYGWRRGLVVERGFHVLPERDGHREHEEGDREHA